MKQALATKVPTASALKNKQDMRFRKQGISYGFLSGITFGLYSTVVAIAMRKDPLVGAVGAFAAPFVTSAINDSIAAIWLFLFNASKGRAKEIGRSLRTFPGLMVILGALVGGPIANGAYLIGIEAAGAAAIPISALCPMFGAIFARIFLKQKIEKRVALGMLICVAGAAIISYMPPDGAPDNFMFGIICALVAALGWGLEGVFSAFGMSMIDSNIAINIRQAVSGLTFMFVVLPIFKATGLFRATVTAFSPMALIALAALFAATSFLTWYTANSMVGVATGMSLNITYVLWGVVFSAIFLGDQLTPVIIAGAIIITLGALLVSINPRELFSKKKEKETALLPIRSRVLHYLSTVEQADLEEVMDGLKYDYGTEKQFTREFFIDHLMSLEANGLIEEVGYDLDSNNNLRQQYRINEEGIHTVSKYLPAKWRS